MVRLSFDMSTIILLFAPFVVPKVIGWALRLLSTRQSVKNTETPTTSAGSGSQPKDQASLFRKRSRYLAAAVLCLRSLLALTWRRPFNIFTSLGDVPLTASISKLSSLLEWRQLSDQYGHLLPQLTSLDARLLYTHFGHDTFTRCQGLCNPNQPSEYLFYHALLLLKAYAIVAVLAGVSNPRMRTWLGSATAAGFFSELYILATTEMRTSSSGIGSLADQLYIYRNIAFMALAAAALVLPSSSAGRQIPPLSIAIQRDVQVLLQHQDQLQIRLRLLEAAKSVSDPTEVLETSPTSSMHPEQAAALKAWLEKILSDDGSHKVPQPAAMHATISGAKVSEVTQSQIDPVKQEQATATTKADDTSEVQKSHVEVADSSSSSSMSSPLQTPTPANHPPPPFDIFASQIQKLAKVNRHTPEEVSKEADSMISNARENIFDQHKSSLDRSAASSIEQMWDRTGHEDAGQFQNEINSGKGFFSPEARRNNATVLPNMSNSGPKEQSLHDNVNRSEVSKSNGGGILDLDRSHGMADSASPPTPQGRKQVSNDDSGWITVTSKKVRQRYDPAA